MRKLFVAVLALILAIYPAYAQAAHSATLTWSAPADSNAATVYNVYRLNSSCPTSGLGLGTWTKVGSGVATLTYLDSTISIGNWCYYVTQVTNGVESAPSTTAGGTAKPSTVTFTVVLN